MMQLAACRLRWRRGLRRSRRPTRQPATRSSARHPLTRQRCSAPPQRRPARRLLPRPSATAEAVAAEHSAAIEAAQAALREAAALQEAADVEEGADEDVYDDAESEVRGGCRAGRATCSQRDLASAPGSQDALRKMQLRSLRLARPLMSLSPADPAAPTASASDLAADSTCQGAETLSTRTAIRLQAALKTTRFATRQWRVRRQQQQQLSNTRGRTPQRSLPPTYRTLVLTWRFLRRLTLALIRAAWQLSLPMPR